MQTKRNKLIAVREEAGFQKIILQNEKIKIEVLPEIGGKIVSIFNKISGREFLLEPQNESRKYKYAWHGANFAQFDTSGFDECFPTVSEVNKELIKDSGEVINYPDHGELWSQPWLFEINEEKIELYSGGINSDYLFSKKIKLKKNRISIDYYLKNNDNVDLKYIWSAHPLLKVAEGAKILLPSEIKKMFLNWSSDDNLGGFGDYLDWPFLNSSNLDIDYSIAQPPKLNQAFKLFSDKLTEGFAGLYFPQEDQSIFFSFNTDKIPFLGLWLCYGGWPEENKNKHFTIALEPSSGRPDSLFEAIRRNEYQLLSQGEETTWHVDLSLWKGIPEKDELGIMSLENKIG